MNGFLGTALFLKITLVFDMETALIFHIAQTGSFLG